jgi:AcrR family transcriptional regulator
LREAQADRTRQLIGDAARAAFLESGWAGTSVRSVAAVAGVSEATVYAVYGSKAGLARSLVESSDAAADIPRLLAGLRRAEGHPARQLAAYLAYDRRLFEHSGPVLRVLVEARRQEPDLAAAYAEGRRLGDVGRRRVFEGWPAPTWRPGMTIDRALDVYALQVSIETYDIAIEERGWSPARLQRWWLQTLSEQLLAGALPA